MAIQPLQVYLCTEDVQDFQDPLDPEKIDGLQQQELQVIGAEARLYWRSNPTGGPAWYRFIEEGLEHPIDFLSGSSSAAILVLKVNHRFFLIVFGRSPRSYLLPGRYELDFGLKVTLNRVAHDKLKSIETKSFEENPLSMLVQAGRETDMAIFNVNRSRDLVSAVAGKPEAPDFGKFNAGKDALAWRGYTDLDGLPALCRSFLEAFESDDYKEHFAWVDAFRRVRGEQELHLRQVLVDHLQARNTEHVVVTPLDMVDWNGAYTYRLKAGEYSDMDKPAPSIQDYYQVVQPHNVIDWTRLSRDRLEVLDEDGQQHTEWPMWQCITFEHNEDGELYVFHGGQWYCIEHSLVDEVDALLGTVDTHALHLPDAGIQQHEGHYNEHAVNGNGLVWMDKTRVVCRDARTPIEPCDLLSPDRHLIHVKCLNGSSSLSHLYVQATTSSRALKVDTAFREGFRQQILQRGGDPDLVPLEEPGGGWTVVLGIITKPRDPWPTGLPFLAKYGMFDCIKELQSQGYQVAVQQIPRN